MRAAFDNNGNSGASKQLEQGLLMLRWAKSSHIEEIFLTGGGA
jgi:hypothetical protein